MNEGRIIVVGIGPGAQEQITPAVMTALKESDVIIGYKYYFQFITTIIDEHVKCVDTGMKRERERADTAFEYAEQGNRVCVISSGDAGIYGMVPLIYEMKKERHSAVEISVLPGISAFQMAASLLGAPIGHDFCVISMSDLMTPWAKIEKRIYAAAEADFVTAVYNPVSRERYWQLNRLKEIFLKSRSPQTPVGYVRQASREEQNVAITTLAEFDTSLIDMFTVVIIGNSNTYAFENKIITPRGYYREEEAENVGAGQQIMINSFRTILSEMRNPNVPEDYRWALLHAIHTTADFDMENLLYADNDAVATLHKMFCDGNIKTIVTDVTMVQSGIRKGALKRLGVDVICYINDEKVIAMAAEKNITRAQASMRIAAEEHPDALYAFGNAPTALIELCGLIRKGVVHPAGIIAAPVGFVHVCESKHMVKVFKNIPKLIVEGRKGGSNLAATLVNSILCYDDAEKMRPGRDV